MCCFALRKPAGDAFVVVGGAPDPCEPRDAAQRVARLALDMIDVVRKYTHEDGRKVRAQVVRQARCGVGASRAPVARVATGCRASRAVPCD